jgi:hypothetical protein
MGKYYSRGMYSSCRHRWQHGQHHNDTTVHCTTMAPQGEGLLQHGVSLPGAQAARQQLPDNKHTHAGALSRRDARLLVIATVRCWLPALDASSGIVVRASCTQL